MVARYRQSALDALAAVPTPVVTVDLLRHRDVQSTQKEFYDREWHAKYDAYLRARSQRIATVAPLPADSSVLLGDAKLHSFDSILISEFSSGAAARDAISSAETLLGPRGLSAGSLTLVGTRSPHFSGLPMFDGALDDSLSGEQRRHWRPPSAEPAAGRSWSDCPFIHEESAVEGAWRALEEEPSEHMLAFNLIRIPDAAAYKHYSSHFAKLPSRHGMRFVEVLALHPRDAILVCDDDVPEARVQREASTQWEEPGTSDG
jgi:hypothetical protein